MDEFLKDSEALIGAMARLFAADGKAREVAVLVYAQSMLEQTRYDNWNGGTYGYTLTLQVPIQLYAQLKEQLAEVEAAMAEKAQELCRIYPNEYLDTVQISPEIKADSNWRDKARKWLLGDGVSNQGRVRSDNVAPRTRDGLLFRSEPEINLYMALKALGVSFAPLPVFIQGGKEYRRIEPDFMVVKDGIMMAVEVDGDTVHQETPAEAHARTTMLAHEGVFIERVKASECENIELARKCASKLIQALMRHKASK